MANQRKNKTRITFAHKLAILMVSISILFDTSSPRVVKAGEATSFEAITIQTPQLPKAVFRKPRRVVTVVATAYSSTPDQTDDSPFIAASGKHVYDGLIAANWLPFGTQVRMPELFGDKIFTVDDRMNERYGYGRIDIWFDAPRATLMLFGVKRAKMEIF